MINEIYRLVEPKRLEIHLQDETIPSNGIVIRPTYMSLCVADQRYFNGDRPKAVLRKKLPMALCHEAIGEVVYDPLNSIERGTEVVLIPNLPTVEDEVIAENYLRTSKFRSSSQDGFMQEIIIQDRNRVLELPVGIDRRVLSFLELISVIFHAIDRFEKRAHKERETLGVWGDGNLGFITALVLKTYYPNSKVIVFGKSQQKLSYFSFVDEVMLVDEIPSIEYIDHAFECVGGIGSQYALNQIIDVVKPEGYVSLMGVSEEPVALNTRMILEKGLYLVGNSRSGKKDFEKAINFLSAHQDTAGHLSNLISSVIDAHTVDDIYKAFEIDSIKKWGKTIIKWSM